MKSLKAAAAVVGSLVVAATAAPAVALDAGEVKGAGVTGSVNKVAHRVDQRLADYKPEVLDPQNEGFVPSTVKGTKSALNEGASGQVIDGLSERG